MSYFAPEPAVLSCLLADNAAFWRIADAVTAEDFADAKNRRLFALVAEGIKAGGPVDPFTLADSAGDELATYALELWNTRGSAANVLAYAEQLRKDAEARRLIRAGQSIAVCGSYDEAQAILAEVRPTQAQKIKSVQDGLREMVDAIQRRYDADGEVSGVPTGLASLDALTSGWQPGNLIVLAARPGMGKTAFALQSAVAAGRSLFFSLEMTAGELIERTVSHVGAFPFRWIRFPKDAPDHASALVLSTSKQVMNLPLLVDDSSGLTVDAISSRARQVHLAEPLKLVVVDHLGLIARPGKHDPSELGVVTSQLKRLAKDLNIPVLLLCQLNRGLEARTDKRPQLADLRDSGRIEEDADIVICAYRDEYYNETGPLRGYFEAIVRKNRSGEQGTAWAKSILANMRLESCDAPERPDSPAPTNHRNAGFAARAGQGREPATIPRASRSPGYAD